MSDFDQAIQEHTHLYKEGIRDKYYQGAKWAWQHQQAIIDDLKAQLNNIEACYIEKKKQVEAVSQVLCELKESLKDFQEMDLYDKGHRVTTEYVIADLEKALRGAND